VAAAVALCVVVAAGCAGRPLRPASGAPPVALELLGAVAYPVNSLTPDGGPRLGSLSGLAFDPASRRWLAATDDIQRPRLAWLDISVTTGHPVTSVRDFLVLTAAPDPAAQAGLDRLDMESLVVLPDGSFAVTNEGHTDRDGVERQPALLSVSRAGVVTAVARPPASFAITRGDGTRGVRHNLGLESLTRTPDGRLVSGLEQPLAQDGPVSTGERGGRVRLIEFVADAGAWTPRRQWAYDLDPTPSQPGYGAVCQDGDNGLSELYALDDTQFIALERACLVGAPDAPAFNPVRLYLVDVAGADDVSSHASLAGVDVRPARKRLLLDLTALIPRLPPALATGSNFEGIASGPPAPDGSPTLLLVSDDNFRPSQTLAFVWLKLRR
jgi:hypothetical protein